MNHASLAARYRPQSFAEVTGQEMVKAILSRAAAEDKVAPAYLLSGTRGVGKTTIARIFAKALNCEHAPVAEPCNECPQCRRITQGNHVDVVEIDGASNRGIDDARRLREAIAYAPMEGRYKVFIIDEAHMLTRESFNALLKTLEEPPPRATFILATTEAHKFPVTIVSRCQHFSFRAIPEAGLVAHLTRVLQKEGLSYEDTAVRLIARRAAGSVRDSMSLLGQTLALGGDALTESAARDVLGLAGQELYERLLAAFKAEDCLAVAALAREILERGVDLGFFLRELALLWRNLFLIRQAGNAAAETLDLPEAERQRLVELAPAFDTAYIHAAWQMVLESQRQILTSIEPAAALELLLLNLALLPRLVSLESLSGRARPTTQQNSGQVPGQQASGQQGSGQASPMNRTAPPPRPGIPPSAPVRMDPPARTREPENQPGMRRAPQPEPRRAPEPGTTDAPEPDPAGTPYSAPSLAAPPLAGPDTDTGAKPNSGQEPDSAQEPAGDTPTQWERFLAFCAEKKTGALPLPALEQADGRFSENELTLVAMSAFQYEQLANPANAAILRQLVADFLGRDIQVGVKQPSPRKTEAELKKELAEHPAVKALTETFDASLLRCIPVEAPRPGRGR